MQICKIAARDERCCIGIATALAFALVLGPLDSVRAASDGAASDVNRLISATFFSDACRQRAASLGILSTTDAQFLIKAFAQTIGADALDVRVERRAGVTDARIDSAGCDVAAVALINLLRMNGVAAELVQISMQRTGSVDPARSDKIPSLAVYVPSLDRYVDPTAPDWQGNAAFDRAVRARAERVHLIGPTPHADPATDPCGGTCMVVYGQAHVSDPVLNDPVRVKTERIHVP